MTHELLGGFESGLQGNVKSCEIAMSPSFRQQAQAAKDRHAFSDDMEDQEGEGERHQAS